MYNPLTDEHCACLDRTLESSAIAIELSEACTKCGFDTTHFTQRLKEQQDIARKTKAMFFTLES